MTAAARRRDGDAGSPRKVRDVPPPAVPVLRATGGAKAKDLLAAIKPVRLVYKPMKGAPKRPGAKKR